MLPRFSSGRLLWSSIINTCPKPQQRPRLGHGRRVYDPCSQYKRDLLVKLQKDLPLQPFGHAPDSGFVLDMVFLFPRPKSHMTSKGRFTTKAPMTHVQRPDIDNLFKLYCDVLIGHVYKDDSAILAINCQKDWTFDPEGKVIIKLFEAVRTDNETNPNAEIPKAGGTKRKRVADTTDKPTPTPTSDIQPTKKIVIKTCQRPL